MPVATLAHSIEQVIYYASKVLLYPVLIVAIICLLWVLVELGWFVYELYLRVRYRDLEALELRTLRARQAFADGQPRKAYRYLQENNYSMVVVRFLFELIRNYQTKQLAAKPLKLLQEYEFYTVKRLEKTRILVRVGPMLGLMGTLIPLAPALQGLAQGNYQRMADQLTIAFSVTVIGLLIGGLAFMISVFRDRIYSQDISDLEYLLELLEGNDARLTAGTAKPKKERKKHKGKAGDADDEAEESDDEPEDESASEADLALGAPDLPLVAALPPDEEFLRIDTDAAPEAEAAQTRRLSLDDILAGLETDVRRPDDDPRDPDLV
jgi:biopolymer transport protein ExbB/TolQ